MSKELTSFLNNHVLKSKFNGNASKEVFWERRNSIDLYNELKTHSNGNLQQCVFNYMNSITDESSKCRNCSKSTKFKSYSFGYFNHCSNQCLQKDTITKNKREATMIERYGVKSALCGDKSEMFMKALGVSNPTKSKEIQDRIIETNLKRYSVSNPLKSKEVQDGIIETNLERYGVKTPSQTKEIQDRIIETNLERYGVKSALCGDKSEMFMKAFGVSNPTKSPEVQTKIKENSMNKRGVVFQAKHILPEHTILINSKEYLSSKTVSEIKQETGYSQSHISKYMFKNGLVDGMRSVLEGSILNYLKSIYSGEIIVNSRSIIPPLELDIFIPEFNFAIEINGDYWHSDEFKKTHFTKYNMCKEKDIYLLQIFEHQIYDLRVFDILKSLMSLKLGKTEKRIFARKTEVRDVSPTDATIFLNDNHIDGACGSSIRKGLYLGGELLSLMSFGSSRFSKDEYELLRFCNKKNTIVVGGASKLFSLMNHREIISFSDNSYSNGSLYKTLGFKYAHETQGYFYISKSGTKIKRFKVQKYKLKTNEFYDESLTETEIMKLSGHFKIFDAKQTKWKYN